MIIIKTPEQIMKMKAAGKILATVHKKLKKFIVPGVSTLEINEYVEEILRENGASPEQKGYMGFPYATCASVNDEICHGFPGSKKLAEGDILTIDMVVNKDNWLADSAWSYAVGKISDDAQKLMDVTKACLYKGIECAIAGNRLGDIGYAIETLAEENGFSVVRDFVGHGIGENMHEDPQVLHYGKPGRGLRLTENMVITIEPMINQGTWKLKMDNNGWTARTLDGKLSCQYEHTLAITKGKPIILTDQDEIED